MNLGAEIPEDRKSGTHAQCFKVNLNIQLQVHGPNLFKPFQNVKGYSQFFIPIVRPLRGLFPERFYFSILPDPGRGPSSRFFALFRVLYLSVLI